jgi:amino acid transporter
MFTKPLSGFVFWSSARQPGQILNGSQYIRAYATAGLVSAWFKQIHPKLHTPIPALVTKEFMSMVALTVFCIFPADSSIDWLPNTK